MPESLKYFISHVSYYHGQQDGKKSHSVVNSGFEFIKNIKMKDVFEVS